VAEAVAGGPCGLCNATESPRWYRAEDQPLCGALHLCQPCHQRVRDALVRLYTAARRCPVAVIEALAERLEAGAAALPAPEPAVTPAP
jgi:hypothetical protein